MDQPDAPRDAAREGLAAPEAPAAGQLAPGPAADAFGRHRRIAAMAGLLAGLAAFALGEATYKWIPARQVTFNTMGTMVTAATAATAAAAEVRNAALAFGLLGLSLGGCLGLAGGLARRSASATATAGLLGAVLGAALAVGVSFATLPMFAGARARLPEDDLAVSMAMHGLIWGLIGGASGLAFAVGMGDRRRLAPAALAGLIGAVLGAVVFDLAGAAFFPAADTGDPVSTTWATRLAARSLVALGTAAGLLLSLPRAGTACAGGRPPSPIESSPRQAA
jgi:hypothetical protein